MPSAVDIAELRQSLREKFPMAHRAPHVEQESVTAFPETSVLKFESGTINEIVSTDGFQGMTLLISRLLDDERELPIALVDGQDSFDPESYGNERCGNLLWIRCTETTQLISVTDLLLKDGNLPLVLLDLHLLPQREFSRIPGILWQRFRITARESGSSLVVRVTQADGHRRAFTPFHRGLFHPGSFGKADSRLQDGSRCEGRDEKKGSGFLMFAALHFPCFELHCLLASGEVPYESPVAVLSDHEREKAHVVALNPAAASRGLATGMSSLSAMGRCAEIRFLNRDPLLEKEIGRELRSFAESLTPDFELASFNTILLDLTTLVFASERDWTLGTLAKARKLALPANLAISSTPDLAHMRSLSAATASSLGSPPGQEIILMLEGEAIRHLAITDLIQAKAFPLKRSNAEALSLWGIRTVSDLVQLPRQGLAERLGPELTWIHDVVLGKKSRPLKLHKPRRVFAAIHDFEDPVSTFDPILFISRRLLQGMCKRLRECQRSATAVHLRIFYDDGFSHARTLHLSESTLNPEVLLRALHTHLDTVKSTAPICSFSLRLLPALPTHKQYEIFKKGIRDPHRFADTLDRISNIVGSDMIGIPQLENSHRPDCFRMHPATPDFEPIKGSLPVAPCGNLPMARFRPPVRVEVLSERRGHLHHPLAILTGPCRGEVLKLRGPFPVSGNWWEEGWQEMQWDVEITRKQILRLSQISENSWVLSGRYGA